MKKMLRFASWIITFLIFCNPLLACVGALQEGFLAGTLVKTVDGYKAIEHIRPSDFICADKITSVSVEQLVTCASKKVIAEYIKIVVGNDVIYAALDQKFYLPQQDAWVAARNIQSGDMFLTALNTQCSVSEVAKMYGSVDAYALTVPDHTYYVGQTGIRVHNMDVVVTPIVIGKFVLFDPAMILISAAVAATTSFLSDGLIGSKGSGVVQEAADNSAAVAIAQDRQSYEQAKNNLLKVRSELLKIKSGIEKAALLYRNDPLTLTHALLYKMPAIKDVPAAIQPSLAVEQRMNETQLAVLKQARDVELQLLEHQIRDVQISLIFHLNELIDARDVAYQEWADTCDDYSCAVDKWNANTQNLSSSFVIGAYEGVYLKQEELIQNLNAAITELEIAIEFYKNVKNAMLLHESSNIVGIITEQIVINADIKRDVAEWANINVQNLKNTEAVLASYNINVAHVRSKASGKIKSAQKAQRAQQIAQAEQRRSSIQPPKEPEKENDKEKHPHGKYENASYHHKNSAKSGKSPAPKDGQKALDNSVRIKDTSPHRVGISEGEFVVLDQTSKGVYHGHVRAWRALTDDMRKKLVQYGMATLQGKII